MTRGVTLEAEGSFAQAASEPNSKNGVMFS